MLSVPITLMMAAALVWYLVRQIRALSKVRSGRDLASFLNARNANLKTGLAIAEVGARRQARQSHGTTHHPATLGTRVLATVLAPAVFHVGNTMLLDAKGREIPADIAPWLGLALLALTLWYLLYIWTYSVELTHDTLRVPGFALFRRAFPLDEVVRVDDTGAYFIKVRFRGGRAVEVLKYVVGRDTLLQVLARRVDHAAESACQSSPKSRPFGAASSR